MTLHPDFVGFGRLTAVHIKHNTRPMYVMLDTVAMLFFSGEDGAYTYWSARMECAAKYRLMSLGNGQSFVRVC